MTDYGNVERSDEEFLNISLTQMDLVETEEARNNDCNNNNEHSYADKNDTSHDRVLVSNALEYLGGYVCHKTQEKVQRTIEKTDTEETDSWVAKISEGGLVIPNKEEQQAILDLESVFNEVNGTYICDKPGIVARMMEKVSNVAVSDKFKTKFLRSRIYIRIRYLNRETHLNKLEKSKKNRKKINKTVK